MNDLTYRGVMKKFSYVGARIARPLTRLHTQLDTPRATKDRPYKTAAALSYISAYISKLKVQITFFGYMILSPREIVAKQKVKHLLRLQRVRRRNPY